VNAGRHPAFHSSKRARREPLTSIINNNQDIPSMNVFTGHAQLTNETHFHQQHAVGVCLSVASQGNHLIQQRGEFQNGERGGRNIIQPTINRDTSTHTMDIEDPSFVMMNDDHTFTGHMHLSNYPNAVERARDQKFTDEEVPGSNLDEDLFLISNANSSSYSESSNVHDLFDHSFDASFIEVANDAVDIAGTIDFMSIAESHCAQEIGEHSTDGHFASYAKPSALHEVDTANQFINDIMSDDNLSEANLPAEISMLQYTWTRPNFPVRRSEGQIVVSKWAGKSNDDQAVIVRDIACLPEVIAYKTETFKLAIYNLVVSVDDIAHRIALDDEGLPPSAKESKKHSTLRNCILKRINDWRALNAGLGHDFKLKHGKKPVTDKIARIFLGTKKLDPQSSKESERMHRPIPLTKLNFIFNTVRRVDAEMGLCYDHKGDGTGVPLWEPNPPTLEMLTILKELNSKIVFKDDLKDLDDYPHLPRPAIKWTAPQLNKMAKPLNSKNRTEAAETVTTTPLTSPYPSESINLATNLDHSSMSAYATDLNHHQYATEKPNEASEILKDFTIDGSIVERCTPVVIGSSVERSPIDDVDSGRSTHINRATVHTHDVGQGSYSFLPNDEKLHSLSTSFNSFSSQRQDDIGSSIASYLPQTETDEVLYQVDAEQHPLPPPNSLHTIQHQYQPSQTDLDDLELAQVFGLVPGSDFAFHV
jgi:hypothetical protein